jgi:hypothetical protein
VSGDVVSCSRDREHRNRITTPWQKNQHFRLIERVRLYEAPISCVRGYCADEHEYNHQQIRIGAALILSDCKKCPWNLGFLHVRSRGSKEKIALLATQARRQGASFHARKPKQAPCAKNSG